jgi:hypothetical protein
MNEVGNEPKEKLFIGKNEYNANFPWHEEAYS